MDQNGRKMILGLGGSDHDFCAAIVCDGELLVAIEDERINLIKHGQGAWHSEPCRLAVQYCLETVGVSLDEIDHIYANTALEARAFDWLSRPTTNISHHFAHAASSFLTSPYDEATLLVVDGAGSRLSATNGKEIRESVSMGYGNITIMELQPVLTGERNLAVCNWRYSLTNSLGHFYRAVTDAIGFGHMGAGKTMGLASFGDDALLGDMKNFVEVADDGSFSFDVYGGFYEWLTTMVQGSANGFMIRAQLASAAQSIFESTMLALAKRARAEQSSSVLCLSGGCALNTVANTKICAEAGFEEVFVPPACGDAGTAVGTALWGYKNEYDSGKMGNSRPRAQRVAFGGRRYSQEEIVKALDKFPVYWHKPSDVTEYMVDQLSAGKVFALFQGGSESGQRALGHRSIIADPSSSNMRDYINLHVKFRETFRPVAPVVPESLAEEYFDIFQPSPFMSFIGKVREEHRASLGAVTHVDGTARLQTVAKDFDEFLHSLLLAYGSNVRPPVLINTSFNIQGQPIVESPEDAIKAFCDTSIDLLYLDGFIAEKHTPWANRPFSSSINSMGMSQR